MCIYMFPGVNAQPVDEINGFFIGHLYAHNSHIGIGARRTS